MNYLDLNYLSICKAIEILSSRADNIFLPINQKKGYDLIVDAKGSLSRIRIIHSEWKTPQGSVRTIIGNIYDNQRFKSSSCEFLFIDTPDGQYLIPSMEIHQNMSITLSKFKKYLIT